MGKERHIISPQEIKTTVGSEWAATALDLVVVEPPVRRVTPGRTSHIVLGWKRATGELIVILRMLCLKESALLISPVCGGEAAKIRNVLVTMKILMSFSLKKKNSIM